MLEITREVDKQIYMTFRGLVKNNGFFKSAKQKAYLLKAYANTECSMDLNYIGVQLKETDVTYVTIDGYYRWCEYGSRSVVPVVITFVLDELGCRAQYKTGGFGNLRDGWRPDASKCKLMWERDESVEKPAFEKPSFEAEVAKVAEENASEWLGNVGDRLTIKGKIVFTKCVGYSQWGSKDLTIIVDEVGNRIKLWKYVGEKDETVEIKGTIKSLDLYGGKKDTVLTRVSIL